MERVGWPAVSIDLLPLGAAVSSSGNESWSRHIEVGAKEEQGFHPRCLLWVEIQASP